MDNFKRHNKNQKKQQVTDGFIRRPANGSKPKRAPKDRLDSAKRIDDFSRPEGFNPRLRAVSKSDSTIPDGTATGRKSANKANSSTKSDMKKEKKLRRTRFAISKTFKTAMAVGLVLAGFLVGTLYLQTTQIFEGGETALALGCDVDPAKLEGEGDGRVNVLLLGKGGPGHEGADLTDTLIVASIDPCQKDAVLMSIPRDMYVQVPENGSMKINSVYATYKQNAIAAGKKNGTAEKEGINAIEATVEDVLDIKVNYYVMVDFEAFRRAIDTVGGISIDVQEQLYDPSVAWENDWDPVIAEEGVQDFNGKKALLYARSRYGSARGDFDRGDRQREVIIALQEKVLSQGTFGNPVKMAQLSRDFGKHLRTNISIKDLSLMYEISKEVEGNNVKSASLADPKKQLVTTGNVGGLSVVLPQEGLYQYDAIQKFVRKKFKDGFIRKEEPRILVLNGTTTPGLAKTYRSELKSYGYNVVGAGDAPSSEYQSNVFVDLTGGDKKYTKRYMELRFNTDATGDVPEGVDTTDVDFVIILGQDETVSN